MKLNFIHLLISLLLSLGVSAQTNDTLKISDTTRPIISSSTIKETEPIIDSLKYIEERKKLIEEWKRFKLYEEIANDELEMLSGPLNYFNKLQETNSKVTERDKKFARAGIQIIDTRQWLPVAKSLASKVRRLLVYIECCL